MSYTVNIVFSFSILIAAVIAAVRFRRISPAYTPFILLIWLGTFNEAYSALVIKEGDSNAVNYNLYSLFEFLILVWQFQKWKLWGSNRYIFPVLAGAALLFWLVENFVLFSIHSFNSYFVMAFSYLLVLMSIRMINILVVRESGSLMKNASFLICLGLLGYFTYSVLLEAFWVYGLSESYVFADRIYAILVFVNLFANLIYALAILWIPTRPTFILPS